MTTMIRMKLKKHVKFGLLLIIAFLLTFLCVAKIQAKASETIAPTPIPTIAVTPTQGVSVDGADDNLTFYFNAGDGTGSLSATLQMLLVLTVITLAPSILIMLTSFTRMIIVMHFVRSALGTQTTPPNQVLIGLALFLTLFIMSPIFMRINTDALQPLNAGEITQEEAFKRGMEPIRDFMFEQTNPKDFQLFANIAGLSDIEDRNDVPTTVLIPSFILSELRIAFIIGFLIYLPFIVIDMVVASTLMSMGMMMLPPTTISMPFKILLFIMADGWNLVIGQLVKTFY